MSFDLKKFQAVSAQQVTRRYNKFKDHDERPGTRKRFKPYFQALSAITGSGKTPMLAQSVAEIRLLLTINPIVLWMSKARTVVSQTYLNFSVGGKYSSLIDGFKVINIKDLNLADINDTSQPLLITLTTGLFNNKDKEEGALNLFQENPDRFGNQSPWEALKNRPVGKERRPLIVVYDEAHNLSDQQTKLLEELEPEAYLVASATLKYPPEFDRNVITPFNSWAVDYMKDEPVPLTTQVDSKAVVEEGLIKRNIHFDGTTANMEKCLDDLLGTYQYLKKEAAYYGITPKAIYVCNTNINEDGDKDDPKLPFNQRKAPPIKIWKYLVDKGIDPNTIAVYTSELSIDKTNKPKEFHLFGSKDDDFYKFQEGNYKHIIFNQSLQEGWDDPECYLGYIDKSIESKVRVEQIIGRVLRQPKVTHYPNPALNTAHFYIRVDRRDSFGNTVDAVKNKLANELNDDAITSTFTEGNFETPEEISPKSDAPLLGLVNIDSGEAKEKINAILRKLTNIKEDDTATQGKSETSTRVLDVQTGDLIERQNWTIELNQTRKVRLRWLITTRIRERSHRVLLITETSDKSFDVPVQFGSLIDDQIVEKVEEAISVYKTEANLDYNSDDEYVFPTIRIRPSKATTFRNSIYPKYSGLNDFERTFAKALDSKDIIWHRNHSSSGGYSIPLLDDGQTANFYPDFLVWKNDLIISLDTKGKHILDEAIKRKLFDIKEFRTTKIITRFITKGKQNTRDEKASSEGYTVWKFRNNAEYAVTCESIDDAVDECLKE